MPEKDCIADDWTIEEHAGRAEIGVTFRAGGEIVFIAGGVLPAGPRYSRAEIIEAISSEARDNGYRVEPVGKRGRRMRLVPL